MLGVAVELLSFYELGTPALLQKVIDFLKEAERPMTVAAILKATQR